MVVGILKEKKNKKEYKLFYFCIWVTFLDLGNIFLSRQFKTVQDSSRQFKTVQDSSRQFETGPNPK